MKRENVPRPAARKKFGPFMKNLLFLGTERRMMKKTSHKI